MASFPVSARGFSFRLLGIPVEVTWWFFLIAFIFGIGGIRRPGEMVVWIGVMLLGILFHEMGHAVAVRAFGGHPAILISGLFNVTTWQPDARSRPWKQLVISLAGPGAGLALGAAMYAWGLSRGLSPIDLKNAVFSAVSSNSLVSALIYDGMFVNVFLSILNLAPIVPLDGGKAVAASLDMLVPGRGMLWATRLSIPVGVVLCGLAVYTQQFYLAILIGMVTYRAFSALSTAGAVGARAVDAGADQPLTQALVEARDALLARDLGRAEDRAELVREKSRTPAYQAQAIQILASIAVLREDWVRADALLGTMPKGVPVDVALDGVVHLRRGRNELAFTALLVALQREPGDNIALAVTEAAVRTGRAARVAELLSAPNVRRHVSAIAFRRVADDLALVGERDGATALRRVADARNLS